MVDPELATIAAAVRLVVLDVDGVLTDGRIYFAPDGQEWKAFNVRDGHGIRALQRAGIPVAVISGRESPAARARLQELQVSHIYTGCNDKLAVLEELLAQLNVSRQQVAYLGDDLPDLSVMSVVGLPVAVADAEPAVCRQARWTTPRPGGHGAVRDLSDLILSQHPNR